MNKIIVIGNLGRDPEMRYTPGGQGFTSFSVAVSAAGTPPAPESSGKKRSGSIARPLDAWPILAISI